MEKLHPKSVSFFFISFLGRSLLFLAVFSGVFVSLIQERASLQAVWIFALAGFAVFWLVFCYVWARLTYRFWGYELANDALKIEKGVIYKKYVSIPYDRIQNIDIHRGIITRILKLSVLQVQTAGYSSAHGRPGFLSEGRLPGLSKEKAENLRETLIKKVKGSKQGL